MNKQALVAIFRDANWLTRERIASWSTVFAVGWVGFLVLDAWTHSSMGITDARGEHIGRDFINYWSGALLAADGRAAIAYSPNEYFAFQKGLAGAASEYKMYSYPPFALLLTLPLALCSFAAGYLLWTIAGYSLCAAMLARHMSRRMALAVALSAPACFINVQSGQNGYFTAALLAGGLLWLDRRPITAGVLFGLLSYKPQLGLLLPVALVSGRHWRTALSAAATACLLVLLSALAFGVGTWPAFISHLDRNAVFMEHVDIWWPRMPTVFGALRVMGAGLPLAYAAQAVSAVCALLAVVVAWRSAGPLSIKAAVLVLAVFLATPYAWDYDMVVVLFALLWVLEDARRTGWRPWERSAWMALVLLPVPMLVFAKLASVQLGAAVLWIVLLLTLRRARVRSEQAQ